MSPEPVAAQAVYASIRSRIAFENLVASVFYGALIGAGLYFVWRIAAYLFAGQLAISTLAAALFASIYFAFMIFLGGFLVSVCVGMQLFEVLERRKLRKAWPYFVTAFIVEVLLFSLVKRGVPVLVEASFLDLFSFLAPGLLIAAFFTRRMRPLWLDAEMAEAQEATPSKIVRLH